MTRLALICLSLTVYGFGSEPSLDELLAGAGRSVERFWTQFPAVTCIETVSQIKVGKDGKTLYGQDSVFDYLILLNLKGDELSVDESRLLQKNAGKPTSLPLLVTHGFSTLLLIFHPYYQGSFEYEKMEDDLSDGRRLARVSFRHLKGTRSTSALRLRGRDYPLDLSGTAWIDLKSGTIEKITAGLVSPMEELNLRTLQTAVRYAPQRFPSIEEPYWLPVEASIDVETPRQHWRNVHRFSNYKHFSVKAESSVPK